VDYGDLPVVRWRPDAKQHHPHNLHIVRGVLRQAISRVGAIVADGRIPLVVGGECSLTIAVVAAFRNDFATILRQLGPTRLLTNRQRISGCIAAVRRT
jgi:arginase family enzyme